MGISPEPLGVPCVSHRLGNLGDGGSQNQGIYYPGTFIGSQDISL